MNEPRFGMITISPQNVQWFLSPSMNISVDVSNKLHILIFDVNLNPVQSRTLK